MTYDSVEKLKGGEMTELPAHHLAYSYIPKSALQAVFSQFGLYIVRGLFHLPEQKSLDKVFPEIKTKTVKEVINSWKGK